MFEKERIPLSTLSPENKQKRLDDLYEYGKAKGTLTYKEIMDRLMELEPPLRRWMILPKNLLTCRFPKASVLTTRSVCI